jgi:hypothetical protein
VDWNNEDDQEEEVCPHSEQCDKQCEKGDLIDHGVLMRQMNRKVSQGKGRLLASNATRLTRKS